jgi:Pyruvate/2-oxoacid:ferredoxin oxidoreductase delta subunit
LAVMDAVMAMEGNGPGSGRPRRMGLILLSDDLVALDTVACRLIDLPMQFVPTIGFAQQAGLGRCDWDAIEAVGEQVEEFVDKAFDAQRRPPVSLTRTGFRRVLRELLVPRPVICARRCIRCGRCIEVCPVEPKAVDWPPNGKSHPPRHDYRKCIRCFCCQEVCPAKAIDVRTPLAGRLVPWLTYLSLLSSRIVARRSSRGKS